MRVLALVVLVLVAAEARTHGGCEKAGGSCIDSSKVACNGQFKSGLCPGSAAIRCCIPAAAPAPVNPTPAPVNPTPAPVTPTPAPAGSVDPLLAIVDAAKGCTNYNWVGRGQAPRAYIRGVALTYAKMACGPSSPDATFVGNAATGSNDALAWYGSILQSKLGPHTGGINTVRQLYTLLMGLGMRESSGVYCTGRDMSASFSSADTAEAGLFQTSWGASARSQLMKDLFAHYKSSTAGCLASVYKAGVKLCSPNNLKNWGTPDQNGYVWQALAKDCPSFSTEYAAILLRLNGGAKGEWGPLRTKAAEVNPVCYSMLGQIDAYIAAHPDVCSAVLSSN